MDVIFTEIPATMEDASQMCSRMNTNCTGADRGKVYCYHATLARHFALYKKYINSCSYSNVTLYTIVLTLIS